MGENSPKLDFCFIPAEMNAFERLEAGGRVGDDFGYKFSSGLIGCLSYQKLQILVYTYL
jgi:hypothetical protein